MRPENDAAANPLSVFWSLVFITWASFDLMTKCFTPQTDDLYDLYDLYDLFLPHDLDLLRADTVDS